MTDGGLRYDRFASHGADEWLTLVGAPGARALLFVPPLFEEMNRTRALLVQAMRLLAADGWRCALPDLPGTGESDTPLEEVEWWHWRDGVTAAAGAVGAVAIVSLRGGALLDGLPLPRWRMAPVSGAALARELERTGLVGAATAGYASSPALLDELRAAAPAEDGMVRTARLTSDRGEADVRLDAAPLWRRAEPQAAPDLAAAMAADIASWIRACAAS